jgi:cysteine desulfurase
LIRVLRRSQVATMNRPLYLDFNATAPVDPRVLEAMRPYFLEEIGNANSRTHVYGLRARDAVENARAQVASLLDARSEEIIFTSGATESNNAVLLGLARHGHQVGRKHVLASAVEHASVLAPLARLGQSGFTVELVPVTVGGFAKPEAVLERLRPDTLLVSMMHANNETGVIQPVGEIGEVLANGPVLFHVDAAQTFGKEVEALKNLRCDFLTASGHKIYGPKGVGVLCIRRNGAHRPRLTPLLFGGGQERNLRPGTLPVPLVVGIGVAAALGAAEASQRQTAAFQIKRQILQGLAGVEHYVNGDPKRTQAHVLNVSFPGVDSEALMLAIRSEVAISNGSACTSADYTLSHVLKAMGLDDDRISSAVRLSWGPGVTDVPVRAIVQAIALLRPRDPDKFA